MSHFTDSRPPSGLDTQSLPTSIFSLPVDLQVKKQAVSNLTKNLMSSSARYVPPHIELTSASASASASANTGVGNEPPRNPPLYSASVSGSSHNNFIPVNLMGSNKPPVSHPTSLNSREYFAPTGGSAALFGGNANYIPLGHNTPTAVSSSYTSNYSHTPSFSSAMAPSSSQMNTFNSSTFNAQHQQQQQQQNVFSNQQNSGTLPGSYKTAAMPTTTVSMDLANPNITLHNQNLISGGGGHIPIQAVPYEHGGGDNFQNQLSNSFVSNGGENGRPIHPAALQRNDSNLGHAHNYYIHHNSQQHARAPSQGGQGLGVQSDHSLQNMHEGKDAFFDQNESLFAEPEGGAFFNAEPDHYMSYKEYLNLLNQRDANESTDGYEEHFNIVDYSVDELITMLACLLTKIIDTNDKLHPNHFDNTIAARQKLKEQKKFKKLESERRAAAAAAEASGASGSPGITANDESGSFNNDNSNNVASHLVDENTDNSSDEEEDELKNRYLANVLAFHGTNVPGISLHAYLTRVLKYCPVTNEVFLSLLVYFDRIAKRANNLKKKKKEAEIEGEEPEQLFVMDSYNIHRLIILGITVSLKFFSDIFYKNLRYAKVGGLPLEELNYLELQFLLLLDFKLMISVEDLQNYGDLLLKFWKREQLASELNKQEDTSMNPEDHML